MQDERIWITWEDQRRNVGLSKKLNAKLFVLRSSRSRLVRYLMLSFRTIRVIYRCRPSIVFAQNPSLVLSALVVLLRPVFRYRAVIDEHNSGLFPLEGESRLLNFLASRIARSADLVVVTNDPLKEHVQSIGGNAVVVPDPIPDFPGHTSSSIISKQYPGGTLKPLSVLFICTWSTDEPYQQVIEAAAQLDPQRFQINITGKYFGKVAPESIPSNVTLLGFLSDEAYVDALAQADAVLVLTTRENCLNCGAYEAVALGKPGVLSDTRALRSHFRKGFVYSMGDASSIAEALEQLSGEFKGFRGQVSELNRELQQSYDGYLVETETSLKKLLN